MGFRYEHQIVDLLLQKADAPALLGYSNWTCRIATELSGYFGVPDVLFGFRNAVEGRGARFRAVAVEAKLANWRTALTQAYRYKAFSHLAYVALDESRARTAIRELVLFQRSGVGLRTVSLSGSLNVVQRAAYAQPYSQNLAIRLRQDSLDWFSSSGPWADHRLTD
jgi:hypothetical protein